MQLKRSVMKTIAAERSWAILLILVAVPGWVAAAEGAATEGAVVGHPASLTIEPSAVELSGRRARQYLLVSGVFSDRSEADLARQVRYEVKDPRVAEVTADGIVLPRGDGETEVIAHYVLSEITPVGSLEARARVRVSRFTEDDPIDFRSEVIGKQQFLSASYVLRSWSAWRKQSGRTTPTSATQSTSRTPSLRVRNYQRGYERQFAVDRIPRLAGGRR